MPPDQSPVIRLGSWEWGAPCQVAVRQDLSLDGLGFERTFVMQISEVADGVRLDFTDIEIADRPFTDAEIAEYFFDNLQVLPSIELDDDGKFVSFPDLNETLSAAYDRTGRPGTVPSDDADLVERFVRASTVDSWFGFWLGRGPLTEDTSVEVEQRTLMVDYAADVIATAALITSEPQIAQFGEKAARFVYREVGQELVLDDGAETVSLEIRSESILEVDRVRPLEAEVFVTLFRTTDGQRRDPFLDGLFRFAVQSYFDWNEDCG